MTGLKEAQLFKSFANKEYRDAFVDEQISIGLAYQIRAIREKCGWTQQELAECTGKAQETISQLENPDYGKFTLKTLKTLASAFDIALMVNFVSFGELIDRVSNLSPDTIAPPDYQEERQMTFAQAQGGSAEWDVSAALAQIPPKSAPVIYWDTSTFLALMEKTMPISIMEIDSTDDVVVRPAMNRPDTRRDIREFAVAA